MNVLINTLWDLLNYGTYQLFSMCKRFRFHYTEKDFPYLCQNGSLSLIKQLYQLYPEIDLEKGRDIAVTHNQVHVARFLIEQGATENLDQCLKIASLNNHSDMAEMLVQKGAEPLVGIRVAKSTNLLRMLYRYKQGSVLIN